MSSSTDSTIEIGSIVELKSGSCHMTCIRKFMREGTKMVDVAWFVTSTNEFKFATLPNEALRVKA